MVNEKGRGLELSILFLLESPVLVVLGAEHNGDRIEEHVEENADTPTPW